MTDPTPDAALARAREALVEMVRHFGYWSSAVGGYCAAGMSALEDAFDVLGWDDPHPFPEDRCDEPGCLGQATCGWPTRDGRYRRTCGGHMQWPGRAP
ncbi:MAG TPA: hypothetical protein VLM76_13510 [Patescibacteria group bacterium]|nr:hypothetical protein [Patescibacteria group bacterium]